MTLISMRDACIFKIKCHKDRVYNKKTGLYGFLDIRTNSYHHEALDYYVKWDGSNQYVPLNEYDPDLYYVDEV